MQTFDSHLSLWQSYNCSKLSFPLLRAYLIQLMKYNYRQTLVGNLRLDIPINRGENGRIFWDDGSNRVLIDNEFASERQLKYRNAVVTLKVVGQVKKMYVKMYELDLGDKNGHQHRIWGYGVDKIMDPDDQVNLSKVSKLFPHVPEEAFSTLPKRRIDILMGLNYNSLHPKGGTSKNAIGNMRALKSMFGCGWVVGGCHKDLQTSSTEVSSPDAFARIAKLSIGSDANANEFENRNSSIIVHSTF